MLTDKQTKRLEELRTKAGLDEKEWEELRKLDRLEEGAAKKEAGEASASEEREDDEDKSAE